MPTATYNLIYSTTLAATTSEVVFGSLPQTYRDLVLVHTGTSTNTSVNSLQVRLNNDSGSNYLQLLLASDAGSVTSASFTDTGFICGYTINTGGLANIAQIMDYSATNKHKAMISRHNALPESRVRSIAGRWANTAAVTSLLCRVDSGASFNAGTTLALYGIIS